MPDKTYGASALHSAMIAVFQEIKRLKKDDRNTHGNYDFTSVDDFKDFVRPLMARHKLIPHVNQVGFQMLEFTATVKGKDERKAAAQFDFVITVFHESGEQSEPEGITVVLPFTGAQTSGAARSYAVKEWIKSRFFASSGDQQDEADLIEQSRESLRLSKADARPLHSDLENEMRNVIEGADYVALGEWWMENKYRIETLPKDWFIQFRTDYATAYKELKAQAELDAMTNEQLDESAKEQE